MEYSSHYLTEKTAFLKNKKTTTEEIIIYYDRGAT